jgi:excisionase family DNA binding protein
MNHNERNPWAPEETTPLDPRTDKSVPQYLTVREVADRLRVSSSLVYRMVESGKIGCLRIGQGRGAIRVSERDLDQFIEQSQQTPTQPQQRHARHGGLRHLKL